MKTALLTFASVLALSSGAFAADAIVEPAPDVFSWTGGYIGVFGGITAGDRDYSVDLDGIDDGEIPGGEVEIEAVGDSDIGASISNSGGLAGLVVGYDYQFNNFVIGGYADIAYSGDRAEISLDADGIGSIDVSSNLDYLGTVQARAGVAVDRALLYAHGGFAYGQMSYDIDLDAGGLGSADLDLDDQDKTGYVVGAGVEYAFTNNVSFQTEYSFVDLGEDELSFDGTALPIEEDVQFHSIKAGFNVRF